MALFTSGVKIMSIHRYDNMLYISYLLSGLWIDAGRLILKSIVMYHSLEKPDWKGISSSQGIMSDILRKIPPGYPQLKEEFQLQEDSPLLEAYNNNKHAAWLSRSETLFLARHLVSGT